MKNLGSFFKGGQWLVGSWEVKEGRKYVYIALCFVEKTKTTVIKKNEFDYNILEKKYDIFETLEYYYFNK